MLTLYYHPDSANIVIHMLLEELGVDYQLYRVSRETDEHAGEAYKRLNPQGLLPVLVDDDRAVFETAAIALYLCEKYTALMPRELPERGTFYQWLFYLSNTLHADLRVIFYAHRHVDAGDSQSEASLRRQSQRRVLGHFGLIEQALGEHGGPWFLGEQLSALDFYLAALCRWPFLYPSKQRLPAQQLDTFPRLKSQLEALQTRPSVIKAFADEGITGALLVDPSYPDPSH